VDSEREKRTALPQRKGKKVQFVAVICLTGAFAKKRDRVLHESQGKGESGSAFELGDERK